MNDFRKGTAGHMKNFDFTKGPEWLRARMARLATGDISLIVINVDAPASGTGVDFFSDVVETSPEYPDWDPLKVLIEAAHEHGIEVQPYTGCFRSNVLGHLFEKEPGTQAIFSQAWPDGRYQGAYACALQPRVQEYLLDLHRSIAERYEVDGLTMDFIRTGTQCSCDYCAAEMAKVGLDIRAIQRKYDDQRELWLDTGTHGLLRKHNARKVVSEPGEVDPVLVDEELDRWIDWRVDRLTHFVAEVQRLAHEYGMVSSAAVKHFWPKQVPTGAQDWVRWCKEDIVDYLLAMAYTNDLDHLEGIVSEQRALIAGSKCQYWPGLGKKSSVSDLTPEQLAEQVTHARDAGVPGVFIFQENALTDEDLALLANI